ncbi:uncharacterized protein LOC142240400 isoform X1 [Haematobia irritans]|uniref:uncharacterized protein LOC142240400 isoform X1 n=1 Tax=Haematobia irritans TaxID=7368 RepID=UPI003F4FAF1B
MDFFTTKYDKVNKIWSGATIEPLHNIEYHSIGRILFSQMKLRPNKVIQIDDVDGKTLTNQEMLNFAIRIAKYLKKAGFRHEEIVGISAKNTTYLSPVLLGCLFNCTPFHTVHPNYQEAATTHCFGITKPRIIFCDGSNYEIIRKSTLSFKPKIYTLIDHIDGVPSVMELLEPTDGEYLYQPEKLTFGADQTVAVLCSSGTTGLPKAVTMSAHKLIPENPFLNGESIYFCPSGMDWATGVLSFLYNCYTSCTRIISRKTFSPEYFVELVVKYEINAAIIPPIYIPLLTQCPKFTTDRMSTLKFLMCGGGYISAKTLTNFRNTVPNCVVTFGYGCTEMTGISANMGFERGNSVGKIVPNVQLRIIDDEGKNLGHQEVGEIVVKPKFKWAGYYGNPKETSQALDSQGWYHTGDLGYMDENDYLFVVDRKKDILKYRSLQFWPGEIENAIRELPEVVDCCVVGIFDEYVGHVAGALVVRQKDSNLSADEIVNYVRERLVEPQKQLHNGVYFVQNLPCNNNGKILKREAREILQSLISDDIAKK